MANEKSQHGENLNDKKGRAVSGFHIEAGLGLVLAALDRFREKTNETMSVGNQHSGGTMT
jgi:hypothetical protein